MSDSYLVDSDRVDVFSTVLEATSFVGKAVFLVFLLCIAGTVFLVMVYTVVSYMAITMAAGAVWRRIKRVCRLSV